MPQPNESLDLLTAPQAAAILMVTPTRVYQIIAEGALTPAVTAGRHQFFRRADIEAYARSREATREGMGRQAGVGLRITRAAAAINSIDQRLATIERLVERIAAKLGIDNDPPQVLGDSRDLR